ncbi:MAG: trigger factor [Gammaproteobacteria bacterium]|nr:trigger factor [Gammaproteobacteria bacterium]
MQVSVETTEGLERRMKVTIPAEKIDSEMSRRFQSLAKTVRLKGFRPGKVPMKVIKGQYGVSVRTEVLEELTRNSFYEALSKENLRLAGYPAFEQESSQEGDDYIYTATFEVMADFDIAPLGDLELIKPKVTLGDQDLDEMLAKLQRQSCRWNAVKRKAKDGDRLVIDFEGAIGGEAFAGGTGKDLPVVLGSKSMIAGFEDGLTGAKADEERTLSLAFPADYHNKEVAGKDAEFKITVKSVEEPELLAIDEDFARAYEVEDGSVETLKSEVLKSMQIELDEAIHLKMKRQVMDALYERNPIELPKSQVESVYQDLIKQRGVQNPDESMAAEFKKLAERNVTLGMVVNRIIKDQGLKPDAVKVRDRVESIAAGYDDPDAVISWYYGDRQRLGNVEALVLEDSVVDWVVSQAKLNEVESSFNEVVSGLSAADGGKSN